MDISRLLEKGVWTNKVERLFSGRDKSNCSLPCTSTKFSIGMLNSQEIAKKYSKIDLEFSESILVSKTDFPKSSIYDILSMLGGAMGL